MVNFCFFTDKILIILIDFRDMTVFFKTVKKIFFQKYLKSLKIMEIYLDDFRLSSKFSYPNI